MVKSHDCNKDIQVHHKGMVPYVAYIVVAGTLLLTDADGKRVSLGPGECIGLHEVWDHKPLPYDVLATKGTSLLHLDRSMLGKLREALQKPLT